MVKKALIYILVLAVIATVSSAVFLKAAKVCQGIYGGELDGVSENGERVSSLVPMKEDRVAVIGRYTAGQNAGYSFYRIYNQEGQAIYQGILHMESASVTISQVMAVGKELRLICTVKPRNEDATAYGAVYTVDAQGKMSEPVLCQGEEADRVYGFKQFICADRAGEYYAGIYNQRVAVFNREGQLVLRLNPEQTRTVTDVRYQDNTFLVAGCTSESGLNNTVHRAFCAAYDMEGTALWRQDVMGEEGILASVLHIVEAEEDEWILYGRYVEDSQDSEITAAQQIAAFEAYEGGMRFQIDTADVDALISDVFILRLSNTGEILKQVAYTDASGAAVPSLVGDGWTSGETFVLQAYTAKINKAEEYIVHWIEVDLELQETLRMEIPVWSDIEMYCVASVDAGNSGLWVYNHFPEEGTDEVRYFQSEEEALAYFADLRTWRPVCDVALALGKGLPLIISLYIMMTVCAMGTARRGKRKA